MSSIAKSGDAAMISGYLGKSDVFDQAIGDFALAYADQNQQDRSVRTPLGSVLRMWGIYVSGGRRGITP